MRRLPRVICAHCHQDRTHNARGLCPACYRRLHRTGGLDAYGAIRQVVPQIDRFDWVVVDRLMGGRPATIHPTERDATARALIARGMSAYRVGELCGLSGSMVADLEVAA